MKKLLLLMAVCSTIYVQGQVITIAKARTKAIGDTFSIKGIISCGGEISASQRFIQDGTGGISLYGSSVLSSINRGDSVKASGTFNIYNGLVELDITVAPTVITSGNKPHAAKVISLVKGGGFDSIYQGQLVRLNSVQFSKSTGSTFSTSSTNYYITNGKDSGQIRIYALTNIAGSHTPKGNISIVGIIGQYCSSAPCGATTFQLIPRDTNDFIHSTEVESISTKEPVVGIYPNPAINELNINLNNISTTALVSIYALDGKMVYQNTSATHLQVHTSDWANGLYLVRVTEEGTTLTRKVTISK